MSRQPSFAHAFEQRIAIRRAAQRDAAPLRRLLRAYFRAIQDAVGPQDAKAAAAFYLRPPAAAWLAWVDGMPAGCVGMRPHGRRACELKHLYVLPRARGLRLGRRLVRAAHRRARCAGYQAIYLDTLVSMAAAQTLYVREGYVTCAPYYHDGVRRIFMRKSFANANPTVQRA